MLPGAFAGPGGLDFLHSILLGVAMPAVFEPATGPDVISCHTGASDQAWWGQVISHIHRWCDQQGVAVRDAVMLLPFSALLVPARQAWGQHGGWMPRVETVATLVQQLNPHVRRDGLDGDAVVCRLRATRLLRSQQWAADWARRDPRAFAQGVAALVRTAQALHAAAVCRPLAERAAWWDQARQLLGTGASGPGQYERALAQIALEWAAAEDSAATDVLFAHRPSAWVVLKAGGPQPFLAGLLAAAGADGVATLCLDADPPEDAPFGVAASLPAPTEVLCADAEAEAQATTACILEQLAAQPAATVALIVQDRAVVRRVRALLERCAVPVIDDTGWRLTTTRAAARLITLLRAARPTGAALQDMRLEWLKDDALGQAQPEAVIALEALWRGQRVSQADQDQAQALWQAAQRRLEPLQAPRRLPLADWLNRLRGLLLEDDPAEALRWREDRAGLEVLQALRLEAGSTAAWQGLAEALPMTLDEFTTWVDEVMEEGSFVPPNPPDARVVITPLARAMLRPFAAVVFPGTDELRLGVAEPQAELLEPAVARALGVPGSAEAVRRETLALAQLLRLPQVTLLRRQAEGAEVLGASPLVERLRLARRQAGSADLPRVQPSLPQRRIKAQPVAAPTPQMVGSHWPTWLSASAVEALRDCPYRFFSRVLLGLSESPELDAGPDKRDYGSWLHAVLTQFHHGRQPASPPDRSADTARLLACAHAVQEAQGLSDADLLPFRASFNTLVPRYLDWLYRHEQAGWHWCAGELEREVRPPELVDVGLRGRLDRMDRDHHGKVMVLDYKTGSAAALRQKVKQPLEDTQLVFYALLVAEDAQADRLQAAYLALDDRDGPSQIDHPDVGRSAQALLTGLATDLAAIRAGTPLRALGRGELCERCEVRGLCRRDHWTEDDSAAGDPA